MTPAGVDLREADAPWPGPWRRFPINPSTRGGRSCQRPCRETKGSKSSFPPATSKGIVSITIRKPSSVTLSLEDLAKDGLFANVTHAGKGGSADRRIVDLHRNGAYAEFLREAVLRARTSYFGERRGQVRRHSPRRSCVIFRSMSGSSLSKIRRNSLSRSRTMCGCSILREGRGFANISAKELLESCLRMRPDRILLQELRDGTGILLHSQRQFRHPGSITTVHSDCAALAFEQLTLLVRNQRAPGTSVRDDIHKLSEGRDRHNCPMHAHRWCFRVTRFISTQAMPGVEVAGAV